jgi:hypothetical protein
MTADPCGCLGAGLPEAAAAGRSAGVKGLPQGRAVPPRALDAENDLLGSKDSRQARPHSFSGKKHPGHLGVLAFMTPKLPSRRPLCPLHPEF